jgi:Rieske 2Fe-2S family protein
MSLAYMSSDTHQLEETLPGETYLDDAHFAMERARIFHAEWFCAGRMQGLEDKGDYRLVNIAGESILIVRGDKLQAFHNVCRHRGAELIPSPDGAEQAGHFQAGIRCPYHSWNYKLNGELHSTPHRNVDKECFGLHNVELDTWGGFVFVRIRSGEQDLATVVSEAAEHLKRYPLADLRIAQRIDYEVAANWKVILENYNECYHCAGVHPELCKIVPAFRKNGGMDLDWDKGIPQKDGTNTFTMTGTSNRAPFPELNDDEKERHKGELIYPNMLISLSMDHAAVFYLYPRSVACTHITCEFLFHPDEMSKVDFDPLDAVEFWDLVNKQDWEICESVQRGMSSQKFNSGFYGPMEDWSLDIRKYVRARMGEE